MTLLVKGGWLVHEDRVEKGDLLIEGEKISAVGPELKAGGAEVLDAAGKYVLPGVIDAHVHYQMPIGDLLTADDFYTGTRSAACGGVTTVIDYAEPCGPGESLRAAIDRRLAEAQGQIAVDLALHLVLFPGQEEDKESLKEAVEQGLVSFKVFTTYDQRMSYEAIGRCLLRAEEVGALVTVHAEDHDIVTAARRELTEAGLTSPRYHGRSRPAEAEVVAVGRIVEMARSLGARAYFVHVSSGEAAGLIASARAQGLEVYGETCPHYLLLTEEEYATERAALSLMCPPLRKRTDNFRLWEALSRETFQVVATDHCSYTPAQKAAGTAFFNTPAGIPGTETLLPLIYSYGVRDGWLTLPQMVRVLAGNPARLFGLYPRKGCLQPGSDADVVVFNPRREVTLEGENLHSAAGYTPFAGFKVRGYPDATILRGRLVYYQGRFLGEKGQGRFIPGRTRK
ncbi:MAG TPA: dihydropyrimidinase [Peptococcaceae bacterium]|nr:MAG: Dihydropyrimidinase [Moorella sp. 60_41]HBT47011.1 dihydropyrimidinase [Peptococcaceae bacterium]